MGRLISPTTEYVYVVPRLLVPANVRRPMGTHVTMGALLCHYGETHTLFPIGGKVEFGETHAQALDRYLRKLAGVRLATNYPMLLTTAIDSRMDNEPARILVYMADVPHRNFNYRCRSRAATMANSVSHYIRETGDGSANLPSTPLSTECMVVDDLSVQIYNWNASYAKSDCFDWAGVYYHWDIQRNLEGIPRITNYVDEFPLQDPEDKHTIWQAVLAAMRNRALVSEDHAR